MKLIKLDAIDSTNDFLKDLSNQQNLDNFTVVSTKSQTNGKGQMGAKWVSEPHKNLIMSLMVIDFIDSVDDVFQLNVLAALSVFSTLEMYNLPNLKIKWPNDIMSDSYKIGGILIENTLKSNGKINSIIGIGLNVNQIDFENLPKASSMAKISGNEFDIDQLLIDIVNAIKTNFFDFKTNYNHHHKNYVRQLFKIDIPMPFANKQGEKFMGIIKNVNQKGFLEVLLEDDSIKLFDLKEIQMLY
jgi:BirA family biotin operon repressor/biotin-[acetyl-CoA-carboxylase] ligase